MSVVSFAAWKSSLWRKIGQYEIVTCAAPDVPEPLIAQLAVGGRLVIPVGAAGDIQHLVVITRQPSGQLRERLMPVRFVPMTGRAQPEPW